MARIKGGMPIGKDGKIHTTFTSNPSTLRSASQKPNLQNIPRSSKNTDDPCNIIRNLIVAEEGNTFYARDYCVDPSTKILKTDLTWSNAINIKVGDELIGFDEDFSKHAVGKGNRLHNAYRPAIVTATMSRVAEKVKVKTTYGEITVSTDHRFLARRAKYGRRWVYAKDLTPADEIIFLHEPWQQDLTRDGGYLAGFLDGEGYVGRTNVGFGQNQGPTLDYVLAVLKQKEFNVKQHGRKTNKNFKYAVVSGIGHQLNLLGTIRPQRLISKSRTIWDGRCISGKCSRKAKVQSVTPIGVGNVCSIETSTGTFIADGFLSHNCGIEAVLVAYFAMAPHYMRLAKVDIHSFYTAWALHELEPGRIPANDLPLLEWGDDKLFKRLADIKKEFSNERNSLYKHLVHGANFMQGPKGAAEKIYSETGHEYPVALVSKVMEIYFALFPEIRKWHSSLLYQADKDGYLKNPFSYVHRFHSVYSWEKIGNKWQKTNGPTANQVIAFLPQSTAAGIIKEAMLRLYYERFEEAGQYMRLLIHDEIFFEVPLDKVKEVDRVVKEEMERPIPEMRLPSSYKMGELLMINTEAKMGNRWGSMKEPEYMREF